MQQTKGQHQILEELKGLVERACKAESNTFGYGIWSHHIAPMLKIAEDLAARRGADREIVLLAVILHDYGGIKDPAFIKDHHLHGAAEAERLLTGYGYPRTTIDAVKGCIEHHRGSVEQEKTTPEEICVADADAIVHIEKIESLFYAAYTELHMGIDEGKRWIREKICRDWSKMSARGREYIRERYEAVMRLLA